MFTKLAENWPNTRSIHDHSRVNVARLRGTLAIPNQKTPDSCESRVRFSRLLELQTIEDLVRPEAFKTLQRLVQLLKAVWIDLADLFQ